MKAFVIFAGFAVAAVASSAPAQIIMSPEGERGISNIRIVPVQEPVDHVVTAAAPAIRDAANDSPIVWECHDNTPTEPVILCARKILASDSFPRITASRLGLFLAAFASSFVLLWLSFVCIEAAVSRLMCYFANQFYNHFYNHLHARILYEMELAQQEEDALKMEEGLALDDEEMDESFN